ncbi:hypothetical protein OAH18_01175 [bacterium]|nr:hypothetical protein [bacterium]
MRSLANSGGQPSAERPAAGPVYTDRVFHRLACWCVFVFATCFTVALFLPAIDAGAIVEGQVAVTYGFACFLFTLLSPAGWPQICVLLSTPLLLRKFNGVLLLRCLVVTAFWLRVLHYWQAFPRDLYSGFYMWLAAITLAAVAHWLTFVGVRVTHTTL